MADIFPEVKTINKEPPVDESQLAQDMIQLTLNGAPAGYKGFKEGEELSATHIISIAMAGRDIPFIAKSVWLQIVRDSRNLRSVNPVDFDTEDDYKTELSKKAVHIDNQLWVDKTYEVNEVSKFSELKTKLDSESETIIKEK